MNRRDFLGVLACTASAGAAAPVLAETAPVADDPNAVGMLVDTTECIGCRKCEFACNREYGLSDQPLEAFEDESVYKERRYLHANAYTIVNRFDNPDKPDSPTYVKSQCMHCLHPACVSACLVGALRRDEHGQVTYTASKCMGCRYCMVACPFEVPAYEYSKAFTPKVQKCGFCLDRVEKEGKLPACAEMCPPMCLTFGKRTELIELARQKIAAAPDRYEDHVYGEHEAGGTAWLYLAPRPFETLGFQTLDDKPLPALTESIQHGIFKFGLLPAMVFGLLGSARHVFQQPDAAGSEHNGDKS